MTTASGYVGYDPRAYGRRIVAEAAAALDRRRPGWSRLVDVSTLDLRSPNFCVLGQVYRAPWWLRPFAPSGYMRGMATLRSEDLATGVFASTDLEPAWTDEILARAVPRA